MRLRRSRQFRRLFAAQTISRWGDTFNTVALVILVFQLTGSGLKVAAMVALEIAPVILLGPFAGALVDHRSRRGVMVAADIARAALMLVLVAAPHQLWLVYVVSFGVSASSVFFNPAASALLPTIVEEEYLVRANSALWSAAVVSQIALAPLAGLLVATAGARFAFAINAVSFVVSAALLAGLPAGIVAVAGEGQWRSRILEGLRLTRTHAFVRLMVQVQALAALSAGATSALLVVLARERLGIGPTGFGALLSAIGGGAALGPLILSRLVKDPRRAPFLFGPYLLRSGVDGVLAITRNGAVAGVALGVYGIGTSTGMVVYNSMLQSRVPEELRGRAFAIFDVVWQTSRLLSLLGGGVIADAFGIRSVYIIGAVLLCAAGVRGMLGARRAGIV